MTAQPPGGQWPQPSFDHPGGAPQPWRPSGQLPPDWPGAGNYPAHPMRPGGQPMPPGFGSFASGGPADAFLPRSYPQLLRGPAHRWWRPLASLAIGLAGVLVLLALAVVALIVAVILDPEWAEQVADSTGTSQLITQDNLAGMLLGTNLFLAAFIPISLLAVRGGHAWRWNWVHSVTGRLRWRWLLAVAGVAAVVQIIATGAVLVIEGPPDFSRPEPQLGLLLAIILLTTPLQAAGEEYLARGWLTQSIGSWFARPAVAVIVSALMTAGVFAALHGAQNFWLGLDRFAFGLFASYVTWRTGGLEAAVAAHAVNNIIVFIPLVLSGTLVEGLNVADAGALLVLFDIATMVLLGWLVTVLAERWKVQRMHFPPVR
ncbi:MAG: hypothetical protein CSA58_01290 [Micrococcales bacterium]|nr:MAG: hypothetical protein CSB46_04155 [Micrococcales bacterium]PIE27999.1 MAG: hypothetical protein CSA58_01290 [Micrococcales bacterium]